MSGLIALQKIEKEMMAKFIFKLTYCVTLHYGRQEFILNDFISKRKKILCNVVGSVNSFCFISLLLVRDESSY